ncbi:MAG: YkgJ family cysteine cluster protein, partial [Pyrinomonadaceae bacterium]|nr:YkgJ family cysteine cluster protein [Pyrinomonadaceae bacterium]
MRVIIKRMNEAHLVQITRRRLIGGHTYERLVGHLVKEMAKRTNKPQIAAERLSGRLADKVIDSPAGIVPDCRTCGACCAFYTCVAVEEGDSVPRSHYWKIGERGSSPAPIARRQMRRDPVTNHCVGLEGEIGRAVRCSIYSLRPSACRSFEAGSDQCHAARRAFGLDPPLTAEQLTRALHRLKAREAEERRRAATNDVAVVPVTRKRE